ncbi:MAG: ketoacyl-ACP synthase III [Kiritimatiellia bacterium]
MSLLPIAYVLPELVLENDTLAALYPGWTAEKIFEKTGIRSRHVSAPGETALDLAERAARKLFETAKIEAKGIDFILFCTQSPDYQLPTSACILQHRLGVPISAGALDFNLGCSGYIYGLVLAKGLIVGGMAQRVLLLTAETYTKHIHPMDKSVRTIFGDGASATLVDATFAERIGSFVFGTDGSGAPHLMIPCGGAREAVTEETKTEVADHSGNIRTRNHLFMDGMEIFNFTLGIVPQMLTDVLEKNRLTREDVGLYVFHQANRFMLETLRKANRLPREKFYVNMEDTGNTVSSSIPIALVRAEAEGRLTAGTNTLLMGFGVGLSWGATFLKGKKG